MDFFSTFWSGAVKSIVWGNAKVGTILGTYGIFSGEDEAIKTAMLQVFCNGKADGKIQTADASELLQAVLVVRNAMQTFFNVVKDDPALSESTFAELGSTLPNDLLNLKNMGCLAESDYFTYSSQPPNWKNALDIVSRSTDVFGKLEKIQLELEKIQQGIRLAKIPAPKTYSTHYPEEAKEIASNWTSTARRATPVQNFNDRGAF